MPNNRRFPYLPILIIAIIVVIIMAVILWFKPDASTKDSAIKADQSGGNGSVNSMTDMSNPYKGLEVSSQNPAKFVTGLENLPRSLKGTEVDGEVIIDENKQLVVTEGLRRMFDYFLLALGEESEETIRARVEAHIRSFVPEPAASQAIAIFDSYVKYLKAIPEIEKRYGNLQLQATNEGKLDLNMVRQQKQDVASLRQQYFNAETISAFFGSESEYDDYSLEMVAIEQNDSLSEPQKQAARDSYISRMPDNTIKQNIKQQAGLNDLLARTEQMKAQGATSEELYTMRRNLVGAPAAARLAEMDRQDDDFDKRFNQYQAQKQQLLSQNANSAESQAQVAQIEQQLFSEAERKRLSGYSDLQKLEP